MSAPADGAGDRLADRVIVITGAAGGFGGATAEIAAARGATVVGADLNEAALEATFRPLADRGLSVAWRATDVTDRAEVNALVAFAIERFGRVDVMVNNAGMMPLAFYSDHGKAAVIWSTAIDVNVKGVINGIAAVYDVMTAQGRGHVVNVSSTYAALGSEGSGVYSATKSAVNVLSESLRVETQGRIKVTIVRPSGVPTTGLGSTMVNPRAAVGNIGHHAKAAGIGVGQLLAGTLPPELADREQITYFSLDAHDVGEAIVHVIDQPWGVSISDITVRAAGEPYLL
jgi:NADP-dependent 3-hydroxy acid dehydrogenase YdfG